MCGTGDTPPLEYPLGDCGMPEWGGAGVFGATFTQFDRHIVTTSDGYELSMVRLTNTVSDGDAIAPFAGAGAKGPILLQHGIGADGLSWL